MMDKALRRMHQRRAKLRSQRRLKVLFGPNPEFLTRRVIGIHAKTPRACSCSLCGNPRRFFRQVTRQEKVAALLD